MRTLTLIYFMTLALGCGSGRVVLVPEDSPVRTGPNVRAQIYVLDSGTWTLSPNKLTIPEGWYVVPPSFVPGSESLPAPRE